MAKQLTLKKFCTEFSTRSAWLSIGWNEIPKVSGEGHREWEELCAVVKPEQRHLLHESEDWFKHAVEIESQQVMRMNRRFERELIKCKKFEDVQAIWNVKGNGKTKLGDVKKIESRFEEIKPQSAVAFHMDHLCAWSVPESLNFTSVAGIYSFGTWFTEAHIEVNGDDSITAIPYGKKVFIYTAGITASRWLLKTVVDIPSFIALALFAQGPPKELKEKLFFCLPESTSLIVQPAFWAHAVLTVEGPALVMGWEAGIHNNEQRLKTVQYSFARGIGMEAQNALRQMPEVEQERILPALPGDAGELLRAQAEAGLLSPGPAKRSRKKKRFQHLPGPKKQRKKLQELQG